MTWLDAVAITIGLWLMWREWRAELGVAVRWLWRTVVAK